MTYFWEAQGKRIAQITFLWFIFSSAFTQDTTQLTISLSLRNVVDLAINQSSSVKYTQNENVSYYWRFQNFQKRFLPQLELDSEFPSFNDSPQKITVDEGSKYIQVTEMEMLGRLSLNQSIPLTGTYVWADTRISRLKNFDNNTTNFSYRPFSIGINQPILAYNWMKWYRKTEPLVYEEAQRNYIERIEEISRTATYRFFNYLRIQTNYNLAASNLKNSQDNLRIAEMKKKLGQISENDFSRIKLSVFNARKDLNEATMELKNADFELKSYIGLDQETDINLELPLNMVLFEIDSEKAVEEALENRKEPVHYKRRLIYAEQQLVRAKRNSGPQINIRGNYGISKNAEEFNDVYVDPNQDRSLSLQLEIPILDWGESASEIKMAEANRDLVVFDVEQDRKDFERRVIVQVEQFGLLKSQLQVVKEADIVAENGYAIALKKFQNGEISITDLNISLSEREKAKRDYIRSLQDYWVAYYNLRILTLYDFEFNRKIIYDNPLLTEN